MGRVLSGVCGVKFELCCLVEILFQLLGWFGVDFVMDFHVLVVQGSILELWEVILESKMITF